MEPASPTVAGTPAQDAKSSLGIPKPRLRTASKEAVSNYILDRLAYENMLDRENEVTEAHEKTLDWIFRRSASTPSADPPVLDPRSGQSHQNAFRQMFTTWLTSMDLGPIYWITGKPGSGKSTLMRFLSQHPKAMELLQQWAGNRPVITAAYYFWSSGSQEQKSMTGLLRYLLHEILSKHRALIEPTFPELWERLRAMSTKDLIKMELDFTFEELERAFYCLTDAALPNANFCLFVDGLDEFDGDHRIAIKLLNDLTSGGRRDFIKICVSSRPWEVFRDAFQDTVPHTSLQDVTYEDMCRYTSAKLEQNAHLKSLKKGDLDGFREFVDSTVRHADGVFLWARLAIESIMKGIGSHYDLVLLNKDLEKLPTDLDGLFHRLVFLFQSPDEMRETAMLFQLIQAREIVADFIKDESARALTLWEFAFALDDDRDDMEAKNRAVEEATDSEVYNRCKTTTNLIMNRFAGLLSLHHRDHRNMVRVAGASYNSRPDPLRRLADAKVTYTHRTVRDWLMESESVYNLLTGLDSTLPAFDPHLRLLRSFVLRLKYPLDEIEHHRRLDEWYPDIALAMTHARFIVKDVQAQGPIFVDKVDDAISWYWIPKTSYDHWARNAFGAYEERMKAPLLREPFLCLASKFGLKNYLEYKLPTLKGKEYDDPETRVSTPLLTYATENLCSRSKTIFPLSDPSLVRCLLENVSSTKPPPGSSLSPTSTILPLPTALIGPNDEYTDFNTHKLTTPWKTLLRSLRTADRRGWISENDENSGAEQRWMSIVNLFIDFGADISTVLERDAWDPEISAHGVFQMLDDKYGLPEVQKLRLRMDEELGTASDQPLLAKAADSKNFLLRVGEGV